MTLGDKKSTKTVDEKKAAPGNLSMKPLTATDGSVLAIIAQIPNLSGDKLNSLLVRVSPDAKEIAQKMIKLRQTRAHEEKTENKETDHEDSVGFIADRPSYKISVVNEEKTSKQKASVKDATTLTAQAILNWARMNKTTRK